MWSSAHGGVLTVEASRWVATPLLATPEGQSSVLAVLSCLEQGVLWALTYA